MRKQDLECLKIRRKEIRLPIFMPDATRGVIRGLDTRDLKEAGVEGLVTNTYHLSNTPGASVLKESGGLSKLMNWNGCLISDSGGFQLLSLVHSAKSKGTITDKGIKFYKNTNGRKNKVMFTPEKSIQVQFNINSDIIICLDDCPNPNCSEQENEESVNRTVKWAKKCKAEYTRIVKQKKLDDSNRPLIFGVIQGGDNKELRTYCYEELNKIGFDGYGFGGWPLLDNKDLNRDILSHVAYLVPNDKPKYALGVGNPNGIVECFKMGYMIFDCVLPTRDGRHARLYNLVEGLNPENVLNLENVFNHMFIVREKYKRDFTPIDDTCDCNTCKNYSRAYLNHLFDIGDTLAGRLATIHNLRTYTRLIEILRNAK